jgi:mycothiol synthase
MDLIGETEFTEDSLCSEWRELDLENDAWLVDLDARIVAYATFTDHGGGRLIVEGFVHPELRGHGLGSKLIDVTESRARVQIPRQPARDRIYLQNATLVGDACTPNLYVRRGYSPARYQFRMVTDLATRPEVPAVRGVEIRRYQEPAERHTVYEVIQDAFATAADFRRRTFEEWSPRVFDHEGFDPTLVWVASESGAIVGANVCGWKEAGDWGWIGSLGVLPSHRRHGIGDALLRTAFAEFWDRGERRVALGVDAENPSATRLYERAGMRVLYTIVLYEKELREAASAAQEQWAPL